MNTPNLQLEKPLQWKMNSTLGNLFLVASTKGLQGVFWKQQAAEMAHSLASQVAKTGTPQPHSLQLKILQKTVQQLEEYFLGKRKSFDLVFDITGTAFQKQVWNELSKIPYGKAVSYSAIALKIKNQRAVRAVGTANGRNPLSIIVPCHRVIAANGTLGGYAGGVEIKKKLLDLEQRSN